MRSCLVITAILVLGVSVSPDRLVAQRGGQASNRPNVVLVMMDDLGYGDIGSYGVPDAKTPNMDRLAREGVRLTNAYANGPVCTPTRTALISGRYQQRVGLEWVLGASPGDPERGLPVTATSLAGAPEEKRLRDGSRRQMASGLQARVFAERSRFRRVFRLPGRRPRLLRCSECLRLTGPLRKHHAHSDSDDLSDRRNHAACRTFHRSSRARAIFHRGRVQRCPLALPAAGPGCV